MFLFQLTLPRHFGFFCSIQWLIFVVYCVLLGSGLVLGIICCWHWRSVTESGRSRLTEGCHTHQGSQRTVRTIPNRVLQRVVDIKKILRFLLRKNLERIDAQTKNEGRATLSLSVAFVREYYNQGVFPFSFFSQRALGASDPLVRKPT
jgi:hypothetical protein